MAQLSIQSDRSSLDHESMDREHAQRVEAFQNMALGISFNGQNVHFAEVARSDVGFSILKFGSIQTNMKFGTGIEGVERNIQSLYSYINGCLEDNAIQAKRMNVSINTHLATIHRVLVEHENEESDYADFVKWEFGQQVLDDIDGFIVNTANLEGSAKSAVEPVLVVGIRRRYVEGLTQVLEKARIRFANLDVDILCTHATYELNYDPSYQGMTAIVECKPGAFSVLLCKDYEIENVYQFTASPKNTGKKLGDLINAHLANMLALYHHESGNENSVIGRVILCNSLAADILPHLDPVYNPELINPFKKIPIPKPFQAEKSDEEKAEGGDEEAEEEKTPEPETDYSRFAECVGAALKLLI